MDLVTGLDSGEGLALDMARGKMYWADSLGSTVSRANLDGTGVEVFASGIGSPEGIAIGP